MSKLSLIEGVGETYEKKLKECGIESVEALLKTCKTKRARTVLADISGISEKLVLKWTNHADLFRIKGVGGEYAELLEAAGVDTVVELSKRKPENLIAKMIEVNEKKELVRKLPTEKQVSDWIGQAGNLPRVVQD